MQAIPIILICLSLWSCQTNPARVDEQAGPINVEMREFRSNFNKLLPLIVDRQTFSAPENRTKIQKYTRSLAKMSHNLQKKMNSNGADVTFRLVSGELKSELKRIDNAISTNRMEYARQNLTGLTSYCIQCHTQGDSGPVFFQAESPDGLQQLSFLQKGSYFTATRQFKRALSEFSKVLTSERKSPYQQLEWEKAMRYSLAIAVREDPSASTAGKIVDEVLREKSIPTYLRADAKYWKIAIEQWKREKTPTPKTQSLRLIATRKLLDKANKVRKFPGDRRADIYLLRAQFLLKGLLNEARADQRPWILFQLGHINENLQNVDFWTLHELYYESCIENGAKTAIAQRCFRRLEQSIVFNYTGSAGYALPADEIRRLNRLRSIAY